MNNPNFPVDPQRGVSGPQPGASNDPAYPEQPASQQDRHDRDELGKVQNPQPAGSDETGSTDFDRDEDTELNPEIPPQDEAPLGGIGMNQGDMNPPLTSTTPGTGPIDQETPGVGQADPLEKPSTTLNDGF